MQCSDRRLKERKLTLSGMITYNRGESMAAKTGMIGGTSQYRSAYGEGSITLDRR